MITDKDRLDFVIKATTDSTWLFEFMRIDPKSEEHDPNNPWCLLYHGHYHFGPDERGAIDAAIQHELENKSNESADVPQV